MEGLIASFIEETRADDGFCHGIGVTIGRRPTVFKVTLLLLADSPGNADAGTAVGDTSRKVVDVGGFMESSQTPGVVQAPLGIVGTDVVLVPLAQFVNGLLNALQTILLPHGLGAKVGMAACTIPVSWNGLGVKGRYHPKVFTHTMQDKTGSPKMIAHSDPFTGSYLEFPLGKHKLTISPCDLDSGVQAGPVVRLFLLPHRSNKDLGVQGSHWKANQKGGRLFP